MGRGTRLAKAPLVVIGASSGRAGLTGVVRSAAERLIATLLARSADAREIPPDRLLYNLESARSPEQCERMRQFEHDRICLFCSEAAEASDNARFRRKHWFVRENDFPYEGAAAHYLIVSRRHVSSFDELPNEAGAELWDIRRDLKARLGAPAFATVERSGDMRLNGGSVDHLHIHLVALEADPSATVRFRVSARGRSEPAEIEHAAAQDTADQRMLGVNEPRRSRPALL